jgi:branched-chain amino acid transport system substrate-binding protein
MKVLQAKQRRRGIAAVAVSVLLAVVAAACGSSGSSGGGGGTTTGSSSPGGSTSKITYTIGSDQAVTGAAAPFAVDLIAGMKYYVDSTNAAGGIMGHKLKIDLVDSQSSPTVAETVYRELIQDSSVIGTTGEVLPGTSTLLGKLAGENKIPLVTFGLSISDQLFNSNPYWFRLAWDDNKTVQAVLEALKSLGKTRISLIYPNDAGGLAGKASVDALAPKLGMTITGRQIYSDGVTDPTPTVLKAKSGNPDAYVVWDPDSSTQLGLVVHTLRNNGVTAPIGVPESGAASAFVTAAGSTVSNVYYWGGLAPDDPAPGIQTSVLNGYKTAFGRLPTDYSFAGYAIGQVYGNAIKKVLQAGQTVSRSSIRAAIESTTDLDTTYGPVTYSATNHGEPLKTVPIIEYVDGKTKLFSH